MDVPTTHPMLTVSRAIIDHLKPRIREHNKGRIPKIIVENALQRFVLHDTMPKDVQLTNEEIDAAYNDVVRFNPELRVSDVANMALKKASKAKLGTVIHAQMDRLKHDLWVELNH